MSQKFNNIGHHRDYDSFEEYREAQREAEKEEVHLFEDREQKQKYIGYCETIGQPALVIDKIRGRKWCFVSCDLMTTGSGPYFQDEEHLIDEAVDEINAICQEFEDEELRNQLSSGALSTGYATNYMSFPDMRVPVARQFAERLNPIIMDESNRVYRNPKVMEEKS